MTDFLIKSTIVLCVLLGTYYVLLEKEKFHQFNRFFLLGSLLISFVAPFVTIEIIQEVSNVGTNTIVVPGQIATQVIENNSPNYNAIGWIIYGLITSLLFFRFANNLYKLIKKTKTEAVVKLENAKLVLLKEETLPYTFLNTIFINEKDYQDKKIEKELFTHELIHVNQKHSLDILLIEIIKIAFWFNPIFIFYKKAIQLNHEFLADEKVVKSYNNVSFYQNLLLSKANQSPIYYLTSNLNYSVTKKRLIMMTKTTSKKIAFLKKITLLPVMTILIFFLCIKTVAQEVKSDSKAKSIQKAPQQFNESSNKSESVIEYQDAIETKPEYPGGLSEFYKFVGKNFRMTAEGMANKASGKIYIQFIIERDGSLSDFIVIKDLGYGLSEEAIRVLKLSPKWIPGTQNGKTVRVMYTLPFTIQSDKEMPEKK